MKNHAMNRAVDPKRVGMESYSSVKQADYTKEAAVYDLKRFSHEAGRFYAELTNQILFDLLQAKKGERILDLATGTGRVSVGLAEKGVSIFGVDLTWKMVEQAKGKAAGKGLQNISFHLANALQLPYKDNTFDKIVSIRFFHILPFEMQKAILQEVRRVLKPGGIFVVEFNSPFAGLFLWALRRDHLVIWPRQVRELFRGMTLVKKVGVMMPGLARIAKMNLDLGYSLGRRFDRFPFNHLCNQILIVARK
ncbi:MAG: class I SAM-dependent methyltransferase [Candidatus Manganitrophaceae bacterium]|nr:MAG: class I SAM-dependent methyltransferase [Candidatus Manganitrophaceae bacterium]